MISYKAHQTNSKKPVKLGTVLNNIKHHSNNVCILQIWNIHNKRWYISWKKDALTACLEIFWQKHLKNE